MPEHRLVAPALPPIDMHLAGTRCDGYRKAHGVEVWRGMMLVDIDFREGADGGIRTGFALDLLIPSDSYRSCLGS